MTPLKDAGCMRYKNPLYGECMKCRGKIEWEPFLITTKNNDYYVYKLDCVDCGIEQIEDMELMNIKFKL